MNAESLTNVPVSILISDPWEFGTECGTGPFTGAVTDATADRLVIALSMPIKYQGKALRTVIAQPRYLGADLESMVAKPLPSNLVLLPMAIRCLSELMPNSQRVGIAAIGTVEKLMNSREGSST
jgi:hypothetical protein